MTSALAEYPALATFVADARSKEFAILGAARGGWYAIQVFRHLGMEPKCICDAKPPTNGELDGITVLTHAETFTKYPKALVVIALLELEAAKRAAENISSEYDCGKAFLLMEEIIHYFMTKICSRGVNPQKYLNTLQLYGSRKFNESIVSPTLSYVMTEKCSLNCEHCGAFVPDIEDPETFAVRSIVSDITRYCSAFDVVHHIALQGGEPFLHKHIDKVVTEISKISNLLFVDIVTNGTITPSDKIFSAVSNCGAAIVMSNYGVHSPKKHALLSSCSKNGIFMDFHEYTDRLWGAQTPIEKRNRSPKEHIQTFRECISDKFLCCSLMNGRLYRCTFSNFTTRLGYIPDFKEDYLEIDSASSDNLSAEIRKIAMRKGPLRACDFCPGPSRDLVPAGIQIPRQKKMRRNQR